MGEACELAAVPAIDLSEVERHPVTDRASWLAMRRQDVTASDIGAICGEDPYRSPLRVYAEKAGLIEGVEDNNLMRRGRWMEPAALLALQELRPTWDARKATVYLRDPAIRLGATPDVVAVDPDRDGFGNVQIKVVARRKFNADWCGVDDEDASPGIITPPVHYRLQTITEAKLLGATWAALVALVIGEFSADLYVVEVDVHDGAWHRIRAEVDFFWRCVADGRAPVIDPSKDASTLGALYPAESALARALDLSGSNELPALLSEREQVAAAIKQAEVRKEEINTILKGHLREHAVATLPGWALSWTTTPASTFTVNRKAMRALRVTRRKAASHDQRT